MAGFRQSMLMGRDASFFVKAVGGGTYSGSASRVYRVRVTTAGASGTAKVTVFEADGITVNTAAATVTSGAAITLGADGATLTLTWSGMDLTAGMEWLCHADTGVNTVARVEEYSPGNGQALRAVNVTADGELLAKISSDIELGAVELKDGASDARAVINAANTTRTTGTVVQVVQAVDAAAAVLSTSALALETGGNLADVKTAVQLIDDAVYTGGSGTPSKGLLVQGSDGTNPRAIKTKATGSQVVVGEAAATEDSIIPAEGTTSPTWIDVRGYLPLFQTDTAFAGTDITFLHSFDGTNSGGPLKDGDGAAVTLVGAATTLQTIIPTGNDAIALAAAYYIKVVKGTAQGAGTPTTVTVGRHS